MRASRLLGAVAVGTCALLLAGPASAVARGEGSFEISGDIDGLYPGAAATLETRVANREALPIQVLSVGAVVRDANPDCPASVLEIVPSTTAVSLEPGATANIPLEVRMEPDAPNACQGATWPLEFVGTAVLVSGEAGTRTPGEPVTPGTEESAGGEAVAREPPAARPGGGLAITGGDLAALVGLGAALLAGGSVALRIARRRHRASRA